MRTHCQFSGHLCYGNYFPSRLSQRPCCSAPFTRHTVCDPPLFLFLSPPHWKQHITAELVARIACNKQGLFDNMFTSDVPEIISNKLVKCVKDVLTKVSWILTSMKYANMYIDCHHPTWYYFCNTLV